MKADYKIIWFKGIASPTGYILYTQHIVDESLAYL